MNEHIIGINIRQLRTAAGITLTALAQKADLTKSTLSKIETGQVSAPISTFIRISDALGVRLTDIFVESKSDPPYVLTRKGKGKVITRDGSKFGYAYEALGLEISRKQFEPFLLTVHPGDDGPTFRHPGQEFIYMLSGKIEFTVGEDVLTLRPGDSLLFDPMQDHQVKVIGNVPARFLAIFAQANTP
ncbi:helix-turn-helix domain-containing protein [Planctomicrobium sp. SH661]|uniref:helix-turn-helix domain-containing protein n=1 Tax=Planctomicrobium sp. SH661 TaxID=3448124 RepID=UPI003F5C3673